MPGASPSEGSSIRKTRASDISPRPSEHIRRSPPESVPALWPSRSARRGKSRSTRSRRLLRSRQLGRERPRVEVVPDRQAREEGVALRDHHDPRPRQLVRRRPHDRLPVQLDLAPAPVDEAHDRAQKRRLPVPVQADEADALTRDHGEIDVVEHTERPVARPRACEPRGPSSCGLRHVEVRCADGRVVEHDRRRPFGDRPCRRP